MVIDIGILPFCLKLHGMYPDAPRNIRRKLADRRSTLPSKDTAWEAKLTNLSHIRDLLHFVCNLL
jgi:hypothetical protein